MRSKKRNAIYLLSVVVFSLLVYGNTLLNGFVFDDREVILENEFIRDPRNLSLLFSRDYFLSFREASYRPVVTLTYFLDHFTWGLDPAGYHLTNLILHALSCAAVFHVLSRLTRRPDTSLAAGFLFCAHPVLTEAVNAISYREDLLALLFCLVSLSAYLKITREGGRGKAYHLLPAGAFLLALFSKESAITFPAVILAVEYCFPRGEKAGALSRARAQTAAFSAVLVTYLAARFLVFRATGLVDTGGTPFFGRMAIMGGVIIHYLRLMVLPLGLCAEYRFDSSPAYPAASAALFLAVVALLVSAGIALRRRAPSVSFGFLWILITLIPVMNVFPLQNPAAERYLYFPMVGFSVILAEAARGVFAGKLTWKRSVLLALYGALLLFWSVLTVRRNAVWKDSLVFYTETLKKCPDSPRFRFDLGNAYFREGRYEEAVGEYREALRLKGDYVEAVLNAGSAYMRMKRYDEAVAEFKSALEKKPDYPEAYYDLGNAYLAKKMYDEALAAYGSALKLKPDFAEAYGNMAYVFVMTGDYPEAIKAYREALEINPDYSDARANLGGAYFKAGEYAKAAEEWKELLRRHPGDVRAKQGLLLLEGMKQR